MVMIGSHLRLMNDSTTQTTAIGEYKDLRRSHLNDLTLIERELRKISPLPCSYDVGRSQQPYFNEFSYTEMLGGVIVTPQSSEAAIRTIMSAARDETTCFDIEGVIKRRELDQGTCDKYQLKAISLPNSDKVVFLPGSNSFMKFVSKENLCRLMYEDEDFILKPHPLTNDDTLRMLGREFGYHRVVSPNESGWEYLKGARVAAITTTTEMGLYAIMMGIELINISNFFSETSGSFGHIYNVLWRVDRDYRRSALRMILQSPMGGWFHPEMPDITNRAIAYFNNAMSIRCALKSYAMEFLPSQYQDTIMSLHAPVVRDDSPR